MTKAYEFIDHSYDVVVIGAGPAGENAADYARQHGLRVAIVELQPQVLPPFDRIWFWAAVWAAVGLLVSMLCNTTKASMLVCLGLYLPMLMASEIFRPGKVMTSAEAQKGVALQAVNPLASVHGFLALPVSRIRHRSAQANDLDARVDLQSLGAEPRIHLWEGCWCRAPELDAHPEADLVEQEIDTHPAGEVPRREPLPARPEPARDAPHHPPRVGLHRRVCRAGHDRCGNRQ